MTGKNVKEMFTCAGKDLFLDWSEKEEKNSPQIDRATLKKHK